MDPIAIGAQNNESCFLFLLAARLQTLAQSVTPLRLHLWLSLRHASDSDTSGVAVTTCEWSAPGVTSLVTSYTAVTLREREL